MTTNWSILNAYWIAKRGLPARVLRVNFSFGVREDKKKLLPATVISLSEVTTTDLIDFMLEMKFAKGVFLLT